MDTKYHDMLISLNTKTDILCGLVKKMDAKLDNHINQSFETCNLMNGRINKRLKLSQLITIISLFIVILGGVIGYNYKIDDNQTKQLSSIQQKLMNK